MKSALWLTLLALFLPFSILAADDVPRWNVLSDKSSIKWAVSYSGKPVEGTFPSFSSDIRFDPTHLDKSSVNVSVSMAKVTSNDTDAQENLPGGDWLAAEKYPAAAFKSSSFHHLTGNNYEVDGDLTLRDKTVKVALPFSLRMTDHNAIMDGTAMIKRLDFGIGQGEWLKTDIVMDEVKVTVHVEAEN